MKMVFAASVAAAVQVFAIASAKSAKNASLDALYGPMSTAPLPAFLPELKNHGL